jgi:hypothetical protein
MKSPIREINAAHRAQRNIEEKENEKPTQSATVAHPRTFYEVHLKEVPIEIEIRDTGAGPTASTLTTKGTKVHEGKRLPSD